MDVMGYFGVSTWFGLSGKVGLMNLAQIPQRNAAANFGMNSAFCDGIKDPEFFPLVSAGPLSRWVREAALGMHYHLIEQLSANNGKQKGDDSEKEGDGGGKGGDEGEKEGGEGEGKNLVSLAEGERRDHPEKFTALYKGGLEPCLQQLLSGDDSVRQPVNILSGVPSDFSLNSALYLTESEQLAHYYARLTKRMQPGPVAVGVLKVLVKTEGLNVIDIKGDDRKKVRGDNLTRIIEI